MEEEVTETKYCSNCRRDIPAANFVMHVTHCQRNLTLCKVCGEPVPTSQQEEHFEEYHAEVKCDCGQCMEKMNLEDHKEKDCPSRLVDCQYCELELPFSELTSHVEYCGSRTEKCDNCDRFVQKKDFEMHTDTGCQYPVKKEKKQLPPKMPDDFFAEMPVGMLHAMGLMDSSESSPNMHNFFPFVPGLREFGQILNTGLGTPPFTGASYFGDIDEANAGVDGGDVIARGARGNRGLNNKPRFDESNFQDCENVDSDYTQEIDDDEMLAAACQADEFDSTNGAGGMSSGMLDEPFPSMKSSLMSDLASDTTKLPCEFCGDLLPMDALILHQSGCQLRSIDSYPISVPDVLPVENRKHNLPPLNNSTVSGYGEFQENHTELETEDRKESDHDVTFLPCEFCQDLFPFDNLIAHQAVCDACPASRPPSDLHNGSAPTPPLNNARPAVRNGSISRPSRPVYESKKIQKSIEDFIPRELDDSSSDLDFRPKESARKPEEYNYRSAGRDVMNSELQRPEEYGHRSAGGDYSAMNNELQRPERKTSDGHSLPGRAVLRNNDLSNGQPSKDLPRVKNRTIDQPVKRQPELRASGPSGTSYKGPVVNSVEEGISRKKLNTGARGKPAAELPKPARVPRTSDSSSSSSRTKPHQSTLNEVTERSKRDLAMQGHKLDAQSSRPPRRTDGVNLDSPSAVRSTASRSSRTKLPNPPPAVSPSSGPVAHSASSNPRRNPPTVTSETVRSNRGRARPQGISSESRPSNTQASAAPPRKPTTRKKIV